MSTESTLKVHRDGAVTILTIHGPGTRNSLNPRIFDEARQALDLAAGDPQIGAVVLTGAEGFFSSGGNLSALAGMRGADQDAREQRIKRLHDLVLALRGCPKPVIAAVEGGAAGAGMSLALAADLLLAARGAFFSAAYIKAGLTPDGGLTGLLAQSLPRQLLTRLCLTGERIGAERLHELGVVGELADPGQVLERAVDLARQLATGPQRATARILDLADSSTALPLEEQLHREAMYMVQSLADDEAAEGIAAVSERRPADFARLRHMQ